MRLFFAVNFDDKERSRLLAIQAQLKAQSVKGNFSRPENLHLTLVFVGETHEARVPDVVDIFNNALHPPPEAFTLAFSRAGCFTHSKKELWWLGTDRSDPGLLRLSELRHRITTGLAAAKIKFDDRPFNTHITLGREIKHTAPIALPFDRITVKIRHISLMRSTHEQGLLTYTELSKVELLNNESY
jgi:2'-5' RNA ligase